MWRLSSFTPRLPHTERLPAAVDLLRFRQLFFRAGDVERPRAFPGEITGGKLLRRLPAELLLWQRQLGELRGKMYQGEALRADLWRPDTERCADVDPERSRDQTLRQLGAWPSPASARELDGERLPMPLLEREQHRQTSERWTPKRESGSA